MRTALARRPPTRAPLRRAPRARPAAPLRAAPAPAPTTAPPTWDEWTATFDQADDTADAADDAAAALDAAVAAQDFSGAAAAKATLDALASQDGVARVTAALAAAVEREDYATAAALADAGATRLVGWWAAAPSRGDPGGHVLRVARDIGRYSGAALRAGDFADAAADVAGADGVARIDGHDTGAPALELFVLINEQDGSEATALSPSSIATQAAVLRPVFDLDDDSDDDDATPGSPASPRAPSSSSSLSASGVTVSVAPVAPGGGPLASRAGAALRVDVSIPDASDDSDGDDAADDASIAAHIVDAFDAAQQRQRRRPDAGADADDEDDAEPSGTNGYVVAVSSAFDVERAPATITWHSADKFTLHAGGDEGEEEEEEDRTPRRPRPVSLARAAAAAFPDWDSDDADVIVMDASDEEEEEEEEESARPARSPRLPPPSGATLDALRAAAADVARHVRAAADAAGAGPLPLSEDELAEYVRGSVADALSGALGADADDSPSSSPSFGAGFAPVAGGITGDVTYTRLPTGPVSTDPFDGLYIGSFGGDGPELLHIQRAGPTDAGTAIATRVAADGAPGCPRAGEARFRASIGRRDRLSGEGPYPPELGVRARYRGTAYVGGSDGVAPVEGELLLFSGRAPVTRGAAMGFVWGGVGERRHLVLMSRVSLDDPAVAPAH